MPTVSLRRDIIEAPEAQSKTVAPREEDTARGSLHEGAGLLRLRRSEASAQAGWVTRTPGWSPPSRRKESEKGADQRKR